MQSENDDLQFCSEMSLQDENNGKIHIDLDFDYLLHSDVVNSQNPVEYSPVWGITQIKQK